MYFSLLEWPTENSMNTYLLLRNNQESGPHTLNELLQLGLKPYDLVWVEGKSAAWRYPSELPELKAHAPVVEEQPYDRFFRREQPAASPAPAAAPEPEKPVFSDYEARFIPVQKPSDPVARRRSVFVTLPAGAGSTARNENPTVPSSTAAQASCSTQASQLSQSSPSSPSSPSSQSLQSSQSSSAVAAAAVRTPIEEPTEPTVRFEQPLEDIKALYVQTLTERRQRWARSRLLRRYGRPAALFLAILTAGLILGFVVLKKPAAAPEPVAQQAPPVTDPTPIVVEDDITDSIVEKMPADAADQSIIRDLSPAQIKKGTVKLETPDPKQQFLDNDRPKAIQSSGDRKSSATIAPDTNDPAFGYAPTRHEPVSGARVKATREEANIPGAEKNDAASSSGTRKKESTTTVHESAEQRVPPAFEGLVKVESNEYRKVALGGIRDLRLTVTNHSSTELAKVVVQLDYLKPSEETLKTELVNFRAVPPNESATIRLPDTNRGTKVRYRIVQVQED